MRYLTCKEIDVSVYFEVKICCLIKNTTFIFHVYDSKVTHLRMKVKLISLFKLLEQSIKNRAINKKYVDSEVIYTNMMTYQVSM